MRLRSRPLNNSISADLQALTALGCMEHRGGCSADDDSGDGAGVMTNLPWDMFNKEVDGLKPDNTG